MDMDQMLDWLSKENKEVAELLVLSDIYCPESELRSRLLEMKFRICRFMGELQYTKNK